MLTRRGFLAALGLGAAAALIEEPIRKMWFVSSNAPVGSRIERPSLKELIEHAGPIHGVVEASYPIRGWNGGYRVTDFGSYLVHADTHQLAHDELMHRIHHDMAREGLVLAG